MYVKFEYTGEDLVDAAMRFLKRSKGARSARVRSIIYGLVLAAVVAGAAAVFVNYLAAAVVAGSMLYALGLHQLTYWESMRGRLHKFLRAQHGPNIRGVCEIELTPVGVCVRQTHTQTTYEWEVIEEVRETPDALEIHTRDGYGLVVRARAFKDAAERRRFVDVAEGYLELSRADSSARLHGADSEADIFKGEEVGGGLEQRR